MAARLPYWTHYQHVHVVKPMVFSRAIISNSASSLLPQPIQGKAADRGRRRHGATTTVAQNKSVVMGSWPGSDGSWKPQELPEEEGNGVEVEAEEEGDDTGVEEGVPVVIAFRDDATGRFRFLYFLTSTTCSASSACRDMRELGCWQRLHHFDK